MRFSLGQEDPVFVKRMAVAVARAGPAAQTRHWLLLAAAALLLLLCEYLPRGYGTTGRETHKCP